MANFGPLAAEIGLKFGAPQQISVGFASWTQSEFCTWQNSFRGQERRKRYI